MRAVVYPFSPVAAVWLIGFVMLNSAVSQEDAPKKAEPSPALKAALAHISEFTVSLASGEMPVEMVPMPLMTYGDAARNNEAGTLWAWGKTGRPAAILELYRNVGSGQPWVHAMTLTSPVRI